MLDPVELRELIAPHRVDDGACFRLADHDPADTGRFTRESKGEARELLGGSVEWLAEVQQKLYAYNRWSLLLVLQGMDASGKDSAIQHVMSGVNPQGCEVHSFKAPSSQELDHDFLWRHACCIPPRGRIGIFNRSYYEEVLVVRVHPEILSSQRMPPELLGDDLWAARFEDISSYERYLDRNGIIVRKFFLHVSRERQRARFLKRFREPGKHWKLDIHDMQERKRWDEYQHAYEDAIRHTATAHAPWFVVPADFKWYARLIFAAAIVDAVQDLNISYPEMGGERRSELAEAREALLAED